jgi:hypothetical protein
MEDKRGVKRERSPSAEGSPLPDDAKTPPPTSSGSPPPPGSPSEVSSRCRCSPVFEQGSASGTTPVSGPSSLVVDTSRDEEFARKLFDDLNRDILRSPGDGKIIIIDDSDDDNEAHAATGAMLLQGQGSIIVMTRGPIRRPMVATIANVAPASLRL